MSNFSALALIIATLFTTNVLAVWTLDRITTRAGQIFTGVVEGIPISTEYRRLLIFQNVLPAAANMAFVDFIGAFVMIGAVQSAGPASNVRWIGYVGALWNVVAGVQWLLLGGLSVLFLRSVVREAE